MTRQAAVGFFSSGNAGANYVTFEVRVAATSEKAVLMPLDRNFIAVIAPKAIRATTSVLDEVLTFFTLDQHLCSYVHLDHQIVHSWFSISWVGVPVKDWW